MAVYIFTLSPTVFFLFFVLVFFFFSPSFGERFGTAQRIYSCEPCDSYLCIFLSFRFFAHRRLRRLLDGRTTIQYAYIVNSIRFETMGFERNKYPKSNLRTRVKKKKKNHTSLIRPVSIINAIERMNSECITRGMMVAYLRGLSGYVRAHIIFPFLHPPPQGNILCSLFR